MYLIFLQRSIVYILLNNANETNIMYCTEITSSNREQYALFVADPPHPSQQSLTFIVARVATCVLRVYNSADTSPYP